MTFLILPLSVQGSDIKKLGLQLTSLVQNNRHFKNSLAIIPHKTMIAYYHQIVQSAVQFSPVAHCAPVTDEVVVERAACSTSECRGDSLP